MHNGQKYLTKKKTQSYHNQNRISWKFSNKSRSRSNSVFQNSSLIMFNSNQDRVMKICMFLLSSLRGILLWRSLSLMMLFRFLILHMVSRESLLRSMKIITKKIQINVCWESPIWMLLFYWGVSLKECFQSSNRKHRNLSG